MKRRIIHTLIHPYILTVMNLLIMVLFYSSIRVTWFHMNPTNHFDEAVELWEGFGTILLGYGVILEERSTLKHILRLDVHGGVPIKDAIEDVCHDYGVFFVLLGVMTEILAWLVKIPNTVLDTYEVEFFLINAAGLVASVGAIFQLKFQWQVLRAHHGKSRA